MAAQAGTVKHPAARILRAAGRFPYPRTLMDAAARWLRELPPATADLLLACGLAVALAGLTALVPVHQGYRQTDALAVVLALLASLVLAFRRRAPLLTLAASLAPVLVYQARGYQGGPALLAPLVALYTIATVEGRLRSLALGVLAGALMSASRLIFSNEPTGTLATDAVGFIGAALFLGWAVANRRAFVAEIQDRAERGERTREEEARRRVDAERLRIARELHDAVAHSIATINVQAGVAAHVVAKRPEQATEALASIRDASKQALAELREILGILRQADEAQPRVPTLGLDQLDVLLETSRRRGVGVELRVEGERSQLPIAVDLAAYRIIQESLTNVIRHAGKATAHVRIGYAPASLRVTVSDDGIGAEKFSDGSGHGIIGMRERARALGGTLEAGPRPAGGFEVSASLPLKTSTAA